MQKKVVDRRSNASKPPMPLLGCLAVWLLCVVSEGSRAQQANADTPAWSDTELPTPASTGHPAGYADPAAILELQAYQSATDGSAWTGMKATGTMTPSGTGTGEAARLSMLPGNRMRLEIHTGTGEDLTIINGSHGFTHYATDDRGYHDTDHGAHSGPRDVPLAPRTAAAGLIPFDLPFAVLTSPGDYVVTDRGTIAVDGKQAHRVTIEAPLTAAGFLPGESKQMVVDCYFDPQSHLLRKMARSVTLVQFGQQRLLQVTSYAQYQTAGQMLLPFGYTETIEGRTMWSLQLATVDTATHPNPEMF